MNSLNLINENFILLNQDLTNKKNVLELVSNHLSKKISYLSPPKIFWLHIK